MGKASYTPIWERLSDLAGVTRRIRGLHGANLYITVNRDASDQVREIFVNRGKADPCYQAWEEAVARLISLCLRANISLDNVVRQLRGITCHPVANGKDGFYLSEPDALAQVLTTYSTLSGLKTE